jgi:sporulation protein YlmC with PRC-barrel domain
MGALRFQAVDRRPHLCQIGIGGELGGMRLSTIALSFLTLVISASAALARVGTTTTELGLRAGPNPNTELLLTMPAGAKVSVGACSRSWCKVNWSGYSGYAVKSGLAISSAPRVSARTAHPPPGEIVPIYPPYPYRSGYYPKADWYFDIPPYTAIEPSFYRRRYFMMSQERNRYRYMPHIFSGGGGGAIKGIDMGRISSALRKDLSTTPTLRTPTSTPPLPTPPPTAPTTPSPTSPQPSPPSPQAPEVSPRPAAPAPSPQAPEVSPLPAAPAPSPQAPEVSPPSAAPGPSPQGPEVSPPAAAPAPGPQAEGPVGITVSELPDVTKGWSVKRTLLNQPIYNEKDERVGSVDDIIVTPDKALSDAIINAGGFLGLTKHNVAIPVSQFKLVDNKLVLPGATKEGLKASPEFRDVKKGWSIKRTLLGQPVYNEMDERVGSVDDIIVTPDKALSYGIINAGGFLGLTKHNVAIPVSQFKLVDNKLVLPGATKKALKASPEFQYAQ